MIWTEIPLGLITGGLCILLVKKMIPNQELDFWHIGLVGAALLYVCFTVFGQAWTDLPLEIGGLLVYALFAWLSYKYSLYFLATGWALHIAWDQLLHPGGHPGYIPAWYPGFCLGFDVAIAVYILYLAQERNKAFVN